jgi:hypothetical protein
MINEIPTISDADGDGNLEECLNNIHLLLENETIIVDILLSSQQVFSDSKVLCNVSIIIIII